MRNFSAFTLAEVLITLGVIGVVAAMTLPVLIQNYRNHITETRLKKFYSTFNQAIQRSVAENGDYSDWDDFYNASTREEINEKFENYILPYMKITSRKQMSNLFSYLYYLPDGSAFSTFYNHNREIYFFPKNAEKCISTYSYELHEMFGICLFAFEFQPLSTDPRWKYLYKKGMEAYMFEWDGNINNLYNSQNGYGCTSGNGLYCTAIIQQNGWKIPKEYPRKIKY